MTGPSASTPRIGPRTIPEALLEKYQRSGPRYTSYPTAPQFKPDFDRDETLRRWRESNGAEAPGLSVYGHLPFCRSRCAYCGCYTLLGYEEDATSTYVDALLDNADWVLEHLDASRPVEQFALGGGTPTYLTPATMARLVEGLQARFTFAADGERSIEVDPRWVDADYLDLLLDLGFNRFSFGLQDLDATVQSHINRELPYEKIQGHMAHLRKRGQSAVNLDLIYGLPGQTAASFAATVKKVIALRPTRIATFGYAHVPWVSPHQKDLEAHGIPGPRERMELFGLAFDLLLDAGWRHVGMDHFALPEDELVTALDSHTLTRNFMGYTTRKGLELVPLGASAIGAAAGTYVQNTKSVQEYTQRRGVERWVKGFVMSDEDVLRREVILGLLCNFYLDTRAVEHQFGVDFAAHFAADLQALAPFVEDGMVEVTPDAIRVTDLGRFFIRNICMPFDLYLRREGGDGTQRYSKTI